MKNPKLVISNTHADGTQESAGLLHFHLETLIKIAVDNATPSEIIEVMYTRYKENALTKKPEYIKDFQEFMKLIR